MYRSGGGRFPIGWNWKLDAGFEFCGGGGGGLGLTMTLCYVIWYYVMARCYATYFWRPCWRRRRLMTFCLLPRHRIIIWSRRWRKISSIWWRRSRCCWRWIIIWWWWWWEIIFSAARWWWQWKFSTVTTWWWWWHWFIWSGWWWWCWRVILIIWAIV